MFDRQHKTLSQIDSGLRLNAKSDFFFTFIGVYLEFVFLTKISVFGSSELNINTAPSGKNLHLT